MLCLHVKIQQLLGLLKHSAQGIEIVFSGCDMIEGESTATIRTVNHDDYAGYDAALMATGRRPATMSLNLPAAGSSDG